MWPVINSILSLVEITPFRLESKSCKGFFFTTGHVIFKLRYNQIYQMKTTQKVWNIALFRFRRFKIRESMWWTHYRSGCYHVCPNHTNFQFDTAFMYTISILILLKIYQTRHPDINANAYSAFGVLAFIIFIGVIGVLHGNVLFWVLFSGLHISSCLVLSFQVNLFVFLQNRRDTKIIKRKSSSCNFAINRGNFRLLVVEIQMCQKLLWNQRD